MSRKILFICIVILLSLQLAAQGRKVALVIGNSAYAGIQRLKNPANDASDVSAALRRLGFTVLSKLDCDRRTMRGLMDDFNIAIQAADVALFYYSVHGVQFSGENFLVPVNAEVTVAGDVAEECVPLSRVTGRMNDAEAATNVIILDACRDNPFIAVTRGIERGLVVVGTKPLESIIVYATAENEKAEDGTGRNGTFTSALLANIEKPLSFTDVLYAIKDQVRRDTGNKQKPAVYDNLSKPVYLAGIAAGEYQVTNPTFAPSSPTITVVRSYGSLIVTAVSAGSLYLDGQSLGDIPAGAEARLDRIEIGERSVELRYGGGEKEALTASVQKGQLLSVNFSWKRPSISVVSKPDSDELAWQSAELQEKMREVNDLVENGRTFANKGDFPEAEANFTAAVDRFPDGEDKFASQKLGEIADSLYSGARKNPGPEGDQAVKDAIQTAREAKKRDASNALPFYTLGKINSDLNQVDNAIAELRQAKSLDPKNYLYTYELGKVYLKARDYEKARQAFDATVTLKPDFENAWYNMGLCNQYLKDSNKALDAYRKALLIKPDFGLALIASGRIYSTLGQKAAAVDAFKKAVQADPANAQALRELGAEYAQTGDNAQAEGLFQKALSLSDDAATNYSLATVKLKLDKGGEAFAFADKAARLSPSTALYQYTLGLASEKSGKVDNAIDAYLKASQLDRRYVEPRVSLGGLYLASGYTDKAIGFLEEAVAIDSKSFEANLNLANAYGKKALYDKSVVYYEKSLSLSPRDTTVRLNLARSYVSAGKTADAIATYSEIIKIDPKMWEAWYGLGQLQASSGESAAAKKTLGDLLSKNPSYDKKAEVQKILSRL